MQDRFKKKLWDSNQKKFIEEFSILYTENENTYFERNPKTKELTMLPTCHITEINCIGLKDSTGKLIYEGDILEQKLPSTSIDGKPTSYTTAKIKIEYYNYRLMVYIFGMDEYWELEDILNSKKECRWKIIGNIYQDTEFN